MFTVMIIINYGENKKVSFLMETTDAEMQSDALTIAEQWSGTVVSITQI